MNQGKAKEWNPSTDAFSVLNKSVYGRGEQPNTKAEPGAVATGRILNLFKAFVLLCVDFAVESLAGRYGSRF